jgi:hypothetical protein
MNRGGVKFKSRKEVEDKFGADSIQWLHTIGPSGGTGDGEWHAFPAWMDIARCQWDTPMACVSKWDDPDPCQPPQGERPKEG